MGLNPRWNKTFRDLWVFKGRTALVVISIAVGVFALGAIMAARIVIADDLDSSYAARNPAHAIMYLAPFEGTDLVNAVSNMRGVERAEARRTINVELLNGEGEWVDMELVVLPSYHSQTIDIITPEEGAWPPRRREVIIERSSLEWAGTNIGDTIQIETRDSVPYQLKVVGTAHDMERISADFESQAVGYISVETLEWATGLETFDELHLILSGDVSDLEHNRQTTNALEDRIKAEGYGVGGTWIRNPGEHPAKQTVDALLLVLGVLGGMSLLLSGFLVINTITAILASQKRQIGIMKAVGASRGQILSMYFVLVLLFGGLAFLIAVPLGALGALWLSNYIAEVINFDVRGLALPLPVLGVQVLIALIAPLIAALYPVFAGARVTVREAVSDHGIGSVGKGNLLDRIMERIKGLPRPMMLSLRNTFRRKGRLTLTLITLTLAGATFISVFSVRDSLSLTLDDAFGYWSYDVGAGLGGTFRREEVMQEVSLIQGVTSVEAWRVVGGGRIRPDGETGEWINMFGVPAETDMIEPILLEGRWLLPDDTNAIVINSEFNRCEGENAVSVGDTLVVEVFERDIEMVVVGEVQAVLTGSIGYVNYPWLSTAVHNTNQVDRVFVKMEGSTAEDRAIMADFLQEHLQRVGMPDASSWTNDTDRAAIEYQFGILVFFLMLMVVLMAVVGGLGLMGTIGINVIERTREIGVMRAVGASDAAVRNIVMVESVIIGLISWLLCIVIAMPLSRALAAAIGDAFLEEPLSFTYSMTGVGLWLLCAVFIALLSSYIPARRASRMSVREVLAYE